MADIPKKSLAIQIDWSRLLSKLGCEPKSRVLPALTVCPVCKCCRLMIFQDFVHGGQWHYCQGCKSKGDMIALASTAWKISIQSAVVKLRKLGFEVRGDIEQYIRDGHRYGEFHNLWDRSAAGQLFSSAKLDQLLTRMYIYLPEVSGEWLAQGLQQIVGGIESAEAQLVFAPDSARGGIGVKRGTVKADTASAFRLFKGKQRDWKHVLVLPLYDLPGRIHNFLFIGRNGRVHEDFVHRKVFSYPSDYTAGLAFHPQLIETKGSVFGMPDVTRYLQMQFRHYKLQRKVLPLVTWYADDKYRPNKAWKLFANRQLVLWGSDLTADLLIQAIRSDAKLSFAGPSNRTNERWTEWFSRYEPHQMLKLWERSAKPWPEAVAEQLTVMPDNEVEELFLRMQYLGEDLEQVVKRCPASARKKIKRVMLLPTTGRSVVVDSFTIEDRVDGWYKVDRAGKEEMISDAKVYVDKVVRHNRLKKQYYRGRVVFRDQVYPFCELKEVIDKNCFAWAQDFLIERGAGVSVFTPSWSAKATAISSKFKPPKLVTGIERIGWDNDREAFVLPKSKIKFGGEIRKHDNLAIPHAPGWDLPVPCSDFASGDIASLLTDGKQQRLFWAAWIGLVHNILAPAFGERQRGMAVTGTSCVTATIAAATAIGCNFYELGKTDDLLVHEFEHDFPIVVGVDNRTQPVKVRSYMEASNNDRNCVLATTSEQASVVTINGGWFSLWDNSVCRVDPEFGIIGKPMLPYYLRWLMENKLQSIHSNREVGKPFMECVFHSVCRWLDNLAASSVVVTAARSHLQYGMEHEEFMSILCEMCYNGTIEVLPKSFEQGKAFWMVPEHNAVFVPKKTVVNLLEKQWAPRLDVMAVTHYLAENDILVGEAELYGKDGWLIRDDAWRSHLHRFRTTRSKLIKLHA